MRSPEETHDPIVVTGLGAVSGWGWSVAELWRGLLSGRSCARPYRVLEPLTHRTRLACEVPPDRPLDQGDHDDTDERRRAWADRLAIAASAEALRRSGHLSQGSRPDRRTADRLHRAGVFFGGSTAAMREAESFFEGLLSGRARAPITHLAAQQINAPGDETARHFGLTGPVCTISSACASGALAIAAAAEALRAGEVDCAVAGGADALCHLTYAGFNSLRAVDPEPCRPFRANRAGLNLGEGAGVLVLERSSDAGSRALVRLLGAGSSCDAHHMTAPHPEGRGAAEAMCEAIRRAGLDPGRIGFVNAHGTGTPLNDRSESRALQSVFGERTGRVPVTSTKGSIGHFLGSSGAIEAVATCLSVIDGVVPPTAGAGEADSDLGLDVVIGEPRSLAADARIGLSTSFAFGGSNAALVFGPAGSSS